MTLSMVLVFAIAIVAVALIALERFPIEQVAIAIPIVLLVAGILDPEEAVSGLSHSGTVTVAAMLILSLGLSKTGAVARLSHWARTAPLGPPRRRLFLLCLLVAAISPFLSNTAVVVVFLPVFLALARHAEQSPSGYLLPLSYSAILGGTVTMIGTSSNLLVYGMARARGFDELSMFSIAPMGLIYLAVGLAYVFTVGRWILPDRPGNVDLATKYEVRSFFMELRVAEASPLIGKRLPDIDFEQRYDVAVTGVRRGNWTSWSGSNMKLREGDVLYVTGHGEHLLTLARKEKLESPAEVNGSDGESSQSDTVRLVEMVLAPDSPLADRTLRQTRFAGRYGATVLAIQRRGETLRGKLDSVRLRAGDLLLIHGPAEALDLLAEEPGFVPLGEVAPPYPSRAGALVAVAILVAVVVAAGTGLVDILPAALVGVVAMLFTGCVRPQEIYEDLDWMVVFTLAGLIPLGVALDETGAAEFLGTAIADVFGDHGPVAIVAGFYLVTSLLTEVMSNNAAAVILTPIALVVAGQTGANPYALLVALMFGASASFMTPVGYQTNTLVYGPGGYRFSDYVKLGVPLNLILAITAALVIPLLWPAAK